MYDLVTIVAFSDELVKIASLGGEILPMVKKVSDGVEKLKKVQEIATKIGKPGTPEQRNIYGGKLYGGNLNG